MDVITIIAEYKKKAIKNKIIISKIDKKGIIFVNEIYKLPYVCYKNRDCFDDLKRYYSLYKESFVELYEYFINRWKIYFEIGMLYYIYLTKEQSSNCYIENYNHRIKLKLSKYLYGKNHCLINCPLFLFFFKKVEEEYRNEILIKEKELVIKNKKVKKFKRIKIVKD